MSIVDEIKTEQEKGKISESEDAYLEFRREIEPGLSNAGFDLIPAKSCDVKSSKTGEPYTDQTLKSHILNGATFGTQINKALKGFDKSASLSREELLEALLLFTSHDFHKTDKLQKKRQESERGLSDEDKDITREETEELVDKLRLSEFNTGLSVKDFRACALSAEEESGRHREVSSRKFDKYSEWVRLMDAAGSIQSPTEAKSLHKRLFKISDDVELHYHRFDDVRGISTNILNTAVSGLLSEKESMEKLVFFENGALYLSRANEQPTLEDYTAKDFSSTFIEQLKDSSSNLDEVENINKALNPDWQKGYIKVEDPVYLIFGLNKSIEGIQEKIRNTLNKKNWSRYSAFEKGLKASASENLIQEVPDYRKPQAIGIYIATLYEEIFQELNSGDDTESLKDICKALDLEVSDILVKEKEADKTPFTSDNIELEEELIEKLELDSLEGEISSVDLHSGGLKSFAQFLSLAYLYGNNSGRNSEKPVNQIMEEISESIISYCNDWKPKWSENRSENWKEVCLNTDTPSDKWSEFQKELAGTISEQIANYVDENLQIDGYRVGEKIYDEKYSQYSKKSQGYICQKCNRAIRAKTTLRDHPKGGFTHLKQIQAGGGQPSQVKCGICDLELSLRELVTDTSGEKNHYLISAPDYFYSPVDIQIEKRIREDIFSNGYELLKAGSSIVETLPDEKSDIIKSALKMLKISDEQKEFQNTLENYDAPFDDYGAIGVYKLEAPRRDNSNEVNRTTHSFLSSYFSVVFSWATSSRVLLTDSAIPMLDFGDFNEMVKITGIPGSIKNTINESVSISRLGDQDEWKEVKFSHLINKETEDEESSVEREEAETVINTGLGYELYKLSALSYISNRRNGTDIQRVTDIVTDRENFTGANKLLKGSNAPTKDLNPIFSNRSSIDLRAADIFDTLVNSNMTNRIEKLAEAGFEAVHPNTKKKSNHEYERLFRVARDSLSDGLAKNASEEELIDIVAGDVMKSATRARKKNALSEEDRKYASEEYTEEPAYKFAKIFVAEIFEGLCESNFYELRKMENRLASGYNAAIRRRSQEWFEEQNNGDSE